MDIRILTTWITAHVERLKEAAAAKDTGQTSIELALIAGALLLGAGLLVVAISTKLIEKINIIDGG